MSMDPSDPMTQEIRELAEINQKSFGKRFGYYAKKSGPGWLQGAITLGGGSLAGALYLGVIAGYNLMWLQPLAMICGVIMLSAISYVTLSTRARPFPLIKQSISAPLAWAWIIATLMANIVWCMPQFNLGRAAVQQNLIPAMGDGQSSTLMICGFFLVLALVVNFFYGSGNAGIRLFERILKILVGIVVISFFAVVIMLTANGGIEWGKIFNGFLPRLKYLFEPAPVYAEMLASAGESADTWKGIIADQQRDKIIAAFGTAVGINMTFLLPYSMLRKRWQKEHRQLAIVDLSIGLIVPFVLATGCVLIASASQFHGKTSDVIAVENVLYEADVKDAAGVVIAKKGDVMVEAGGIMPRMEGALNKVLGGFKGKMGGTYTATSDDRKIAAMLANRDNFNLADSLKPLAGDFVAQKVFGIGVVGMAISTIIILMLINGFVFCEIFNRPGNRGLHLLGCLVAGIGGFFGPFLWTGDAKAALAIPTSVIGGSLIPIAYFTFFLLMNSKKVLGDNKPTGGKMLVWNILMLFATAVASFGSIWVLWAKANSSDKLLSTVAWIGLVILAVLFVLGLLGFFRNNKRES